jgi:protein TonB
VSYIQAAERPRYFAIGMVTLIHLGLAAMFIIGLAYTVVEPESADLKTFDVVVPVPPAPEPAPEPATSARPTEVDVAPSPVPVVANPLSSSDTAGPPRTGSAGASSARHLRGAFNNEVDYPDAARRREEQGTVRVSYTVGADGRVSQCTVVASSGSSSLDSTTCRIFERRFRYTPARDAGGNPVPATLTQSVTWRLT